MKTKTALLVILLLSTFLVIAQSEKDNTRETKRIDSLEKVTRACKRYSVCSIDTALIRSVMGEKIIKIQKLTCGKMTVFTLETSRTGNTMSIKSFDLLLYRNELIKATIFYNQDKKDFWESFYYRNKGTSPFSGEASPWDMSIQLDQKVEDFRSIGEILNR